MTKEDGSNGLIHPSMNPIESVFLSVKTFNAGTKNRGFTEITNSFSSYDKRSFLLN